MKLCERSGKISYATRRGAEIAMRGLKARKVLRDSGGAGKITAYECEHCGAWHFGHRRQGLHLKTAVAVKMAKGETKK